MEVHKNSWKVTSSRNILRILCGCLSSFIVDVKSPVAIACSVDGVEYEVGAEIPSNNSCKTWHGVLALRVFCLSI